MPVRLGYNAYAQPFGFKEAAYDGGSEGGMVHVGICAEEDYISTFPTTQLHFFSGGREPV